MTKIIENQIIFTHAYQKATLRFFYFTSNQVEVVMKLFNWRSKKQLFKVFSDRNSKITNCNYLTSKQRSPQNSSGYTIFMEIYKMILIGVHGIQQQLQGKRYPSSSVEDTQFTDLGRFSTKNHNRIEYSKSSSILLQFLRR